MMKNERRKRWLYAVSGFLIMLVSGDIYAWNVFSASIARTFPAWGNSQLSLVFTIALISFCTASLAAGFLGGIRSRWFIWAAAALFLGGLIICGRAQSLPALYVGFGVVCGFASGLSYSATMGAVNQWFPDCQGLVSGVMLMGFGFSSFFAGKLFQVWTAADNEAWRQFFVYLGAASVIVLGICGTFIKKPSEEQKLRLGTGKGTGQFGEEVPPSGMVRQPVFWLFYLWAVLDSALGLALISQAVGIARESSVHVSEGTIVSFVGLISVFTGIGRAVFGRMFDKKGRNLVMQSINALLFLMGVALMAALRIKCFPLTAAAFLIGGLAYGGAPTTCSAYVGARFGLQNYPRNFPVVATNLLFSSFGGTIAGKLYESTGSYLVVCAMICGVAAVSAAVTVFMTVLERKKIPL